MFIPLGVALVAVGFLCFFGRSALWRIAHSRAGRSADVATPAWEWSMIALGSLFLSAGAFLLIR